MTLLVNYTLLPYFVATPPEKDRRNFLKKLVERIGIDRSVLVDFVVTDVDTKKLSHNFLNFLGDQVYTELVENDDSPVELADGRRIGKLTVKDSCIGKFSVRFETNNLTGEYNVRSTLELLVSETGNNLQNLNAEEYRSRIVDVFHTLKTCYGITADFSTI